MEHYGRNGDKLNNNKNKIAHVKISDEQEDKRKTITITEEPRDETS